MRILVVCRDLGRGGTQRAAQNFAIAYKDAGHAAALFAYVGDGPRKRRVEAEGIPLSIGLSEESFEQIEAFDPDVIHIHRSGMTNSDETAILRRLKTRRRRVVETNVFARVDYSEGNDLIDVHFHLSAWCLWKWRKWMGRRAREHAAVVVPYGVEAEDIRPASGEAVRAFREKHGIPAGAFVCGRIGQPVAAKWHAQNIGAFAQLAREDGEARMVVVGLPDCLKGTLAGLPPEVRGRVIELPVTDSDEDLSVIYSSLDCFLHAAQIGESFGLVLAEAMMCNCPVVTASRPHKDNSQLEVVGHKQGGLVAGSVDSLGDALVALRKDQGLREKIRCGARERVLRLYDINKVAAHAVRAAAIALESPDRRALVKRLDESAEFQTQVSDGEIAKLLGETIGGAKGSELFWKAMVHRPGVQRVIRMINRLRLGA